MKRTLKLLASAAFMIILMTGCGTQKPARQANYAGSLVRFKALIHYTEHAELAHVQFAHQSIDFFKKLTVGDGFKIDVTTDLSDYTLEELMEYNTIISVNTAPHSKAERELFEQYMENGGGWVGFHAAAYNDKNTKWPWFLEFIGGGVFNATTGLLSLLLSN